MRIVVNYLNLINGFIDLPKNTLSLPKDILQDKIKLLRELIPSLNRKACDAGILYLQSKIENQTSEYAKELDSVITILRSEGPFVFENDQKETWEISNAQMKKLAAGSTYFKALSKGAFSEEGTKRFSKLLGYTQNDIEVLLQVLEDPNKIDVENAQDVLDMADYFDCPLLKQKVVEYFIKFIQELTAEDIAENENMGAFLEFLAKRLPKNEVDNKLYRKIINIMEETGSEEIQAVLIGVLQKEETLAIRSWISKECVKMILKECSSISELVFYNHPNINELLASVSKEVTSLEIDECNYVTDEGMNHIAKLNKLKRLELHICERVSASGLNQLITLTNLQDLNISNSQITDPVLADIAKHLTKLQKINLSNCHHITKDAISQLASLKELKYLSLFHCHVTDAWLKSVALLTGLQHLDLTYCFEITDAGLASLASMQNLRNLDLYGTKISGIGVAPLKTLHCLDFNDSQVTDAGLAGIATLTQLRELQLYYCKITDNALLHLINLSNLRQLDVRLCKQLTSEGLSNLKKQLPELTIVS